MSPQNGAAIDITLREINEWAREPGKATYRDQLSREPNSERMHDGPKSQQTQDQYKHKPSKKCLYISRLQRGTHFSYREVIIWDSEWRSWEDFFGKYFKLYVLCPPNLFTQWDQPCVFVFLLDLGNAGTPRTSEPQINSGGMKGQQGSPHKEMAHWVETFYLEHNSQDSEPENAQCPWRTNTPWQSEPFLQPAINTFLRRQKL